MPISHPHQDRKCVFLNDQNECTIYDDRPSVCRTNTVLSDPAACSTEDGKENLTELKYVISERDIPGGLYYIEYESKKKVFSV